MAERYKSAVTLEREARRAIAQGLDGAEHLLVQSLIAGVSQAVAASSTAASVELSTLAERFGRGVAPAARRQAHRDIGETAQNAVLNKYAEVVRHNPPYRTQARNPNNRRFAGGALRRALGAPNFFEATADGLRFINITLLNKEARHWARLNAGAGSIGEGSHQLFPIVFGDLLVGALGLDQAAREAFTLPPGYWFDRSKGVEVGAGPPGTSEFYPTGPASERKGTGPLRYRTGATSRLLHGASRGPRGTRGIQARHFLDAGLESIANNLPVKYEELYANLWAQTSGSGGRARVSTTPRAGRVSRPRGY